MPRAMDGARSTPEDSQAKRVATRWYIHHLVSALEVDAVEPGNPHVTVVVTTPNCRRGCIRWCTFDGTLHRPIASTIGERNVRVGIHPAVVDATLDFGTTCLARVAVAGICNGNLGFHLKHGPFLFFVFIVPFQQPPPL